MSVYTHIVTYQDTPYLSGCLAALFLQDGVALNGSVTHNGEEGGDRALRTVLRYGWPYYQNKNNLGFTGAHNQGVSRFLQSNCDALLIINPDCALQNGALEQMYEALFSDENIGMVCPLLLRADEDLNPIQPHTVDSSGVVYTSTLRHFDRFAEVSSSEVPLDIEEVSGASGACILLKRECVEDLLLSVDEDDDDLFQVFPQLKESYEKRAPLFDEAFFAYREDAELSLRARKLGWRIVFDPKAIATHVRKVTPERRNSLSPDINRHSVRNRFLLQFLHWHPWRDWKTIVPGFMIRNCLVIAGVLFSEQSSIGGLREAFQLGKRALARRRSLAEKTVYRGALWS